MCSAHQRFKSVIAALGHLEDRLRLQPAAPSGVPHYLRIQTEDQAGNQAEWTTLFTLLYDGEPLITDLAPPNGSVITNAWPLISATASPTPRRARAPALPAPGRRHR